MLHACFMHPSLVSCRTCTVHIARVGAGLGGIRGPLDYTVFMNKKFLLWAKICYLLCSNRFFFPKGKLIKFTV